MPVTRCLVPFARDLSRLPLDRQAWAAAIDDRPEQCPHNDCTANCREACKGYANVQWKCAKHTAGRGRR